MILEILVVAAARTLVLGLLVGFGLKLLRRRNPHAELTIWTVVLIASLAMPLLMQVVRIPVTPAELQILKAPLERSFPHSAPEIALTPPSLGTASTELAVPYRILSKASLWRNFALALYIIVALFLLARVCVGGFLSWRLARSARPISEDWAAGLNVRTSDQVTMPVTLGRMVILPLGYQSWPMPKRRAVLAHERSHVERRDFLVQLIAALNRVVFWFSPFAWWLEKRLVELAETASDDAAIEQTGDRTSYAELLLEMMRESRSTSMGLSMARPNTVHRRVDRILASSTIPKKPRWHEKALIAVALAPIALVAASSVEREANAMPTQGYTGAAQNVAHGWLGIGFGDLTPEVARTLNLSPSQRGAIVSVVMHGSAAEAAGLRAGDLILALNQTPTNMGDLYNRINVLPPGTAVDLTVFHDILRRDVHEHRSVEDIRATLGSSAPSLQHNLTYLVPDLSPPIERSPIGDCPFGRTFPKVDTATFAESVQALYRANKISKEGAAVLRIDVDVTGRVAGAVFLTSSGARELDDVALNLAGNSWHYVPGSVNGVPQPMSTFIRFKFARQRPSALQAWCLRFII